MTIRLTGHALRSEGRPYEVKTQGGVPRLRKGYRAYWGMALCSCGATSTILKTNDQRKQWHRDHKNELKEGTK